VALHDFFFKLTAVKHCRCLEHRAFFSEEDERNTRNERGFCVTYEYVGPLAIENGEKKAHRIHATYEAERPRTVVEIC
jgi:hypothetical protein